MGESMKKSSKKKRELIFLYGFICPWIIGFLLFQIIPMTTSLYYSFTETTMLAIGKVPPKVVGFANYVEVFKDDIFLKSIGTTFLFAFLRVFLGVFLSLLVAILLNKKLYMKNVWRTLVYLPAIIPVVGAALVWSTLFSSDFSLMNFLLSFLGIPGVEWLSYDNAFWSVLLMSVWSGIGPTMIIILAGLQNIPKDLMEAADIDGASRIKKFSIITIPLLSATLLYNLVTGFIGALQSYAEMDLLTGDTGFVITMAMNVVNNAFSEDKYGMGYASALAWVMFVIILIFTLIFF